MHITSEKVAVSNITTEELQAILESRRSLQDFIDLADSIRKSGKGNGINYFQQFFMKAQKFV